MQCRLRAMADSHRVSDTLPKKGKVTQVCKEWLVREDGALAFALQKQEVEEHYHGNKWRNSVVREDFPLALTEQRKEEEAALIRYQRQVLAMEEQDEEVARGLAMKLEQEEDEERIRKAEMDHKIALQMQVKERRKIGDFNIVGLPVRQASQQTQSSIRDLRISEDSVDEEAPALPPRRASPLQTGTGQVPARLPPRHAEIQQSSVPLPPHQPIMPVAEECAILCSAEASEVVHSRSPYRLSPSPSDRPSSAQSRSRSSPDERVARRRSADRELPDHSQRKHAERRVVVAPTSVDGASSPTDRRGVTSPIIVDHTRKHTTDPDVASTPTRVDRARKRSVDRVTTPTAIDDSAILPAELDAITPADEGGRPGTSRDEDAIQTWPPPPTTPELDRHMQELRDQEVARRLQEELETEVEMLERDHLLAMEAQDMEIAKMLQDKEKAKVRRARERAKARAMAKRQDDVTQREKKDEDETASCGDSVEGADVSESVELSPPSPGGAATGQPPERNSREFPPVSNALVTPHNGNEVTGPGVFVVEAASVLNSVAGPVPNIAAVIDPTYSMARQNQARVRTHQNTTDSLEDDAGLPYFPVQGQRRTSSLDKKKRKDKSKDSSCKQQ